MMEVMPVASQPIYQFYAELKDYKPLIWRRFQVAGNITLAQLGYVTMTLFEMKGSHLFHLEYSVNENMPDDDPAYQSEPDKILRYDIAGGDSFPETMISNTYAATEMTLRRFTSRGDATFHFFYDYGDGWEVVLRLEEVFEDSELPGKELPRVLEGQGFGIIEDCGGPAGLEHLREVFQQKSSPEYQSMREWLGTSEVDLSVFDLQDLNFRLKKLPRIFRDLLGYTRYAAKGCPPARKKLHNAAALAGASYGNIVDAVTPHLPYFPTEQEVSINDNDLRCAELAERLGFDDCRAMFTACQAL